MLRQSRARLQWLAATQTMVIVMQATIHAAVKHWDPAALAPVRHVADAPMFAQLVLPEPWMKVVRTSVLRLVAPMPVRSTTSQESMLSIDLAIQLIFAAMWHVAALAVLRTTCPRLEDASKRSRHYCKQASKFQMIMIWIQVGLET